MNSLPVQNVLSRLEHVRQTTDHQWFAYCPHGHRSQSKASRKLAIKEGDDGQVMLHCHAGCDIDHIVGLLGLEMKDLWPPHTDVMLKVGLKETLKRRDSLKLLAAEGLKLSMGANDLLRGKQLSEDDLETLRRSSRYVYAAIRDLYVRGSKHGK